MFTNRNRQGKLPYYEDLYGTRIKEDPFDVCEDDTESDKEPKKRRKTKHSSNQSNVEETDLLSFLTPRRNGISGTDSSAEVEFDKQQQKSHQDKRAKSRAWKITKKHDGKRHSPKTPAKKKMKKRPGMFGGRITLSDDDQSTPTASKKGIQQKVSLLGLQTTSSSRPGLRPPSHSQMSPLNATSGWENDFLAGWIMNGDLDDDFQLLESSSDDDTIPNAEDHVDQEQADEKSKKNKQQARGAKSASQKPAVEVDSRDDDDLLGELPSDADIEADFASW